MKSLITSKAIEMLTPLFLLFSIYLLFRGHNEPGGGFIGGLIGALPFVFHSLINGVQYTKKKYHINTIRFIGLGIFCTAFSTIISLLVGLPFLTAVWADFHFPILGHPGTPMLFDVGVYLAVIGVVLKITFTMADE
jgi:multicomponent Na+:H+ antiporter subunit B